VAEYARNILELVTAVNEKLRKIPCERIRDEFKIKVPGEWNF
jgi:hypothetical protein